MLPILLSALALVEDARAADRVAYYADRDADGYGDRSTKFYATVGPAGSVRQAGDCDDTDAAVHRGAFEFCSDGDDNDCDGEVDECDVSLDDAGLIVQSSARGRAVRGPLGVGDIDGDGTGDLVVGSYPYDPSVNAVYLLYGPLSGTVLVDDAVQIGAMRADDSFGWGIGGGDADGDGFDDLLVGAPLQTPSTTYLFLGPITSDRNAGDADTVLINRSGHNWGLALLVTADHDGDGDADVVVGSADDGDSGDEGAVYVVPGATKGQLSLDRDATYIYEGGLVDYLGAAVADLGDVNGDGIDELAMSEGHGGAIRVIDGGLIPGRYSVADVAATTIAGTRDAGGFQAVDYDGDGAMDLIAGDPQAMSSAGDFTGRVYAFVAPWSAAMDVGDAMAVWEWTAAYSATGLGRSLAASDFDGDGETDVFIGANGNYSGNYSGAVFFQWGVASGVVDVATLPYVTGSFDGAILGEELAALPDQNGDGIPEAVVAAYNGADDSDGVIYGLFSGSY